MSDKPKKESKPPGKISRFFSALVAWPRSLSLPVAASLVLALFLGIGIIVVWMAYRQDPNNVPWGHYMTGGRLTMLLVLYLVTPLLFYGGLKFWLEGTPSDFPEIDYAWKAGLKALKDHGLSIESLPLFLILGSTGEEQEQAIMDATGFQYRVRGVPEGPAPIHWYANPERIDLFCTNVGALTLVSELVEKRLEEVELARQEQRTPPQEHWPGREPSSILGPMSSPEPKSVQAVSEEPMRMGTMVHKTLSQVIEPPSETKLMARDHDQMRLVAPAQMREAIARLDYVCHQIQIARQPVCGINGVLTLMRFRAIRMDDREAQELERSLRLDLRSIQRQLQLRCPITALDFWLAKRAGISRTGPQGGPREGRLPTVRASVRHPQRGQPNRIGGLHLASVRRVRGLDLPPVQRTPIPDPARQHAALRTLVQSPQQAPTAFDPCARERVRARPRGPTRH